MNTDYLLIGCGVVGAGILHYLKGNIVVVDQCKKNIVAHPNQKILFVEKKLDSKSFQSVLEEYSQPGTIIIETAEELDTKDLALWAHHSGRHFINSATEGWCEHIIELTNNYERLDGLMNLYVDKIARILNDNGTTCLLTHGANPGMVNHYLNYAIHELSLHKHTSFAKIVDEIKAIYILEKDTLNFHPTYVPHPQSFYNTWNVGDFFLESIAPVYFPNKHRVEIYDKPKMRYVFLDHLNIYGRLVTHEETFSMQHYLQNQFQKSAKIQFIYECSPIGERSRIKWKFGEDYIPHCALKELDSKIGYDLVGTLVMLQDGSNWFCGSCLTQERALNFFDQTNATEWYVSAAMLAGIEWLEQNKNRGISFPEMLGIKDSMAIIESFKKFTQAHFFSMHVKNLFLSDYFDTYACVNLFSNKLIPA